MDFELIEKKFQTSELIYENEIEVENAIPSLIIDLCFNNEANKNLPICNKSNDIPSAKCAFSPWKNCNTNDDILSKYNIVDIKERNMTTLTVSNVGFMSFTKKPLFVETKQYMISTKDGKYIVYSISDKCDNSNNPNRKITSFLSSSMCYYTTIEKWEISLQHSNPQSKNNNSINNNNDDTKVIKYNFNFDFNLKGEFKKQIEEQKQSETLVKMSVKAYFYSSEKNSNDKGNLANGIVSTNKTHINGNTAGFVASVPLVTVPAPTIAIASSVATVISAHTASSVFASTIANSNAPIIATGRTMEGVGNVRKISIGNESGNGNEKKASITNDGTDNKNNDNNIERTLVRSKLLRYYMNHFNSYMQLMQNNEYIFKYYNKIIGEYIYEEYFQNTCWCKLNSYDQIWIKNKKIVYEDGTTFDFQINYCYPNNNNVNNDDVIKYVTIKAVYSDGAFDATLAKDECTLKWNNRSVWIRDGYSKFSGEYKMENGKVVKLTNEGIVQFANENEGNNTDVIRYQLIASNSISYNFENKCVEGVLCENNLTINWNNNAIWLKQQLNNKDNQENKDNDNAIIVVDNDGENNENNNNGNKDDDNDTEMSYLCASHTLNIDVNANNDNKWANDDIDDIDDDNKITEMSCDDMLKIELNENHHLLSVENNNHLISTTAVATTATSVGNTNNNANTTIPMEDANYFNYHNIDDNDYELSFSSCIVKHNNVNNNIPNKDINNDINDDHNIVNNVSNADHLTDWLLVD